MRRFLTHDHLDTSLDEGTVSQLGHLGLLEGAVAHHLGVLHQHVSSGDPHVGELDPAIVNIVASLWKW